MKSRLQIAGALVMLGALPVLFGQAPPPIGLEKEKALFFSPVAGGPEQNFTYVSSAMRIDGAVVKNAPYSAQAITETTQKLADGNRISRKSTASLYRDTEGRTRREETMGPMGVTPPGAEPIQSIFINDPVAGTSLVLDSRNKTAHSMPRAMFAPHPPPLPQDGEAHVATFGIAVAGAGPVPPDVMFAEHQMKQQAELSAGKVIVSRGDFAAGNVMASWSDKSDKNVQKESLGTQVMEGVQAEGTRTTFTIPAGQIGNDLPIQIVSERWYSPDLQTVVMTKHSDPRMGDTVYKLTNILRNEPSQSLFTAPADYTLVEGKHGVVGGVIKPAK
jgi:hypothetical protein